MDKNSTTIFKIHSTDLTKEIKCSNSKMVSCWEWPSTCYLANKLKKFTKCPAGQILKYKSNNKKIKYLKLLPVSTFMLLLKESGSDRSAR